MIAVMIASSVLALADPATASVSVERLNFNATAQAKLKPSAEVRVTEKGQEVVYKGIPLRRIPGGRTYRRPGCEQDG